MGEIGVAVEWGARSLLWYVEVGGWVCVGSLSVVWGCGDGGPWVFLLSCGWIFLVVVLAGLVVGGIWAVGGGFVDVLGSCCGWDLPVWSCGGDPYVILSRVRGILLSCGVFGLGIVVL